MSNFPEISLQNALAMQSQGAMLIDVRSPQEYAAHHLPGSINLPLSRLPAQIRRLAQPHKPILLYCSQGHRSHSAALVLARMGYKNIYTVKKATTT